MITELRKRIANIIRPKRRVEIHENWQASSKKRLGEHTDKAYDHYAQYYATVDGEHCNIGFDIYVADVDGRPEARINLWETTERWQMHKEYEKTWPQIRLVDRHE